MCMRSTTSYFSGLCGVLLFAFFVQAASAQPFEVVEQDVEEGELEIEAVGAVQLGFPEEDDDDEEETIRHAHEMSVEYGVTHFWRVEFSLATEAAVDASLRATNVALENTIEILEQGVNGLGVSLFASVEPRIHRDATNEVELGPIFSFAIGEVETTVNAFFEKTFGRNREEGWGHGYAVQSKIEIDEGFGVGVEAFGEIENIGDVPAVREQEHRLGPVVYFEMPVGDDQELTMDFGVLFGLTPQTPDVAVKWSIGLAL